MGTKNHVEVKVDYHLSGKFTLKERKKGEKLFQDVKKSMLLGNSNAISFYRAVARRLVYHAKKGTVVTKYSDTSLIGIDIKL